MTVDERLRLNIHTKLSELLGSDEADALMSRMFSVPWHDVPTKDDLRVMSAELRAETADLRTELRTEMAGLRTGMADLRSELHTEMADLRSELHTEMAGLRTDMADLRTSLHQSIVGQTRWLTGYVSGVAAVMFTVAGLLF